MARVRSGDIARPRGQAVTAGGAGWAARCIGCGDAALPDEDLAALAAQLKRWAIRAGDVLFTPGKRPAGVWVIRTGAIELAVGRDAHRLVLQVLRAGDVAGDVPLLTRQPLPYEARAVQAASGLLLPAAAFTEMLSDHPALARLWLSGMTARFAGSQARILALLDGGLPQRAASLLLREARQGSVDLPQATLAAMIGTPRPSLNRVLRRFESAAMISLRYRHIQILRPGRLAAIAHSRPDAAHHTPPRLATPDRA